MSRRKNDEPPPKQTGGAGVNRRDFLKIGGLAAAVPVVTGPRMLQVGGAQVPVYGPDATTVTLNVNGKKLTARMEPRVTLLDALRDEFQLTGAKRVCDRGTCGACTVLMDGKAVYSCSTLAIDAQSAQITTIEGLGEPEKLHPVMQAFVDNDAQQCGFCTPGFVVACKAFLDRHANPTLDEMKTGVAGNFCRCGTYAGMRPAILQAAKALTGRKGA
jgi:xanthine dehydrogenase YagT iron-sulfur-binding subunit